MPPRDADERWLHGGAKITAGCDRRQCSSARGSSAACGIQLRMGPGARSPGRKTLRGRQVGAWRLEWRIGAGGQGEVWKVLPARGDRSPPRALKLCIAEDPVAQRRFASEVSILVSHRHERIMPILESDLGWEPLDGFAKAHAYFVMPLGAGTLADEQWTRDTLTALRLFKEACEGIRYLHQLQEPLFHRDIKPSNIVVLDEPLRAVVSDMGIATTEASMGELTATHEVVGSRWYRAPEVGHGNPATVQSDIYGLGRVLERILTGLDPRDMRPRPVAANQRGLSTRAAEALDAVIRRAAAPQPEDRFGSVDELLEAIPELLIDFAELTANAEIEEPALAPEEPGIRVPFSPGGELGSTVSTYPDGVERRLTWKPGGAGGFAYLTLAPTVSLELNPRDRLKAVEARTFRPFGWARRLGGGWNRFSGEFWHGVYFTDLSERRPDEVDTTSATFLMEDGTMVGITSEIIVDRVQGRLLPSHDSETAFVEGLFEALEFLRSNRALIGVSPPLRCSAGIEGLLGTKIAWEQGGRLRFSRPTHKRKIGYSFVVNDLDVDPAVVLRPFFEDLWACYELDRPE